MRACSFAVAEVELTRSLPMQAARYGFRESLLLPLPAPAFGIPNTVGEQPIQISLQDCNGVAPHDVEHRAEPAASKAKWGERPVTVIEEAGQA
jgi:hypothetical protein